MGQKVWAQNIEKFEEGLSKKVEEKLRELKKKKKLMKLGKNWKSQGNKPENQGEDALGKIEQQQDFVTFLEPQLWRTCVFECLTVTEGFWKSPWYLCTENSKIS